MLLATSRGSYVEAKLLSTFLCVALFESPEKVTARVSSTKSQGSPSSLALLVLTPS